LPDEKMAVLHAIEAGKNICITGCAGTGKSFLLKIIKEKYIKKGLHVTAATGIAAVHIGGTTLHSFAALGTGIAPAEEILRFLFSKRASRIRRKLKETRMLAIDEISMISASVMNLLDQVFQSIKQNDLPFGGIQVVVIGDFFQLPPVSQDNQIDFCFISDSWQNADFKVFELTEVYRQSDLSIKQIRLISKD
jgi:ATP-dependent DNA helicase PIF1